MGGKYQKSGEIINKKRTIVHRKPAGRDEGRGRRGEEQRKDGEKGRGKSIAIVTIAK